MELNTTPEVDEMPSSPIDASEPVNCDPTQPPTMLWNIKATDKSAIYDDLGVNDLEGIKAPPKSLRHPPQLRHHTTPTDNVTLTQQLGNPGDGPIPVLTTPSSSTRSDTDHIHNGTSCSCKRRLLDEINSTDSFACLADEILLHILKWLPLTKLSHCSRVCKRWYRLAFDELLWRRIDLSSKQFFAGILGNILQRGPVAVKLSRAKIEEPVFSLNYRHKAKKQCNKLRNGKQSITTKVQYLDLSACDVSTSTLQEIIKSCPPLRKLSLESCMVNVSVLTCVGQKAQELEELNLSMCEGVIDYGMMQLLVNTPNLTSLNLAWTSLNKQTLTTLTDNIPTNLEKLNLSGCGRNLEDNTVDQILHKCPKLRELDISDSPSVSEAIFSSLVNHGNIQYLALNRCYSLHYSYLE
ncbi:S-phase kinase-associated protein 2-like [Amphiura filiformis]|uniref:S-phase kinase-associated protein 2-like n=1 Tax=Amphiura filiformis TaxID=82378 RepID=UPI003B225802